MHKFRVFLSYSHEDLDFARQIKKVLQKLGLDPIMDDDIRPGMPFTDEIKGMITHAHIFMPLITRNSQKRPWVHQETGYAMALNIPVLPVAVRQKGQQFGEMTAQLQAIVVEPDLSDLSQRLVETNLEQVVCPPPHRPVSVVQVAEWPEERTEWMAQFANRVVELGSYGMLRQRGALSSFCMPDKTARDPIWNRRDGDRPRSEYYHQLQREERRALERHAQKRGCRLIIDPTLNFSKRGREVTKVRLEILLKAFESLPDGKTEVVISPRARRGNLTIVGDWFVAESMVPRPEGYRQTVFSWHAPTVLQWVRRFDQEFEELAEASGIHPRESRLAAIRRIRQLIREEKQKLRKRKTPAKKSSQKRRRT